MACMFVLVVHFQIQPEEQISREEFACLIIKSIRAGATDNLNGSLDKYSDEGASRWTNEINILAANDVIPPCSSIADKFCPNRKITIGEVSYIVNALIEKSLFQTTCLTQITSIILGHHLVEKLLTQELLLFLILTQVTMPVCLKTIQMCL